MFSNMLMSNKVAVPPPSGWSPSSLFAASEVGFWYDPSDLTTLFQDSAGTVPVTAAGQTVQMIKDKSGNNFHGIIDPNTATYNTDGTSSWLDMIETNSPNGIHVALNNVAFGMTGYICGALRTDSAGLFLSYSAHAYTLVYSSTQTNSISSQMGAPIASVNGIQIANSRKVLYDNIQTKAVVDVINIDLTTPRQALYVFGYPSGGGFTVSGRMYGAIQVPGLNTASMANARTWMGNKVGLTL